MNFTQLDPTLPVDVIGKGPGYAFAVIDYGQEHNLIWVVALNESGGIERWPSRRQRLPDAKSGGAQRQKARDEPRLLLTYIVGLT